MYVGSTLHRSDNGILTYWPHLPLLVLVIISGLYSESVRVCGLQLMSGNISENKLRYILAGS